MTVAWVVACALLAAVGARWGFHQALVRGLRAPRVPHGDHPVARGLPLESVHETWVAGPHGTRLFAWLVDAQGGPFAEKRPAVLLLHGWGSNAAAMLPLLPGLAAAGWHVLLLEARCHGRSSDAEFTSLPRFAEDLAHGLSHLRGLSQVDGDRVAVIGHSVGAAAALLHASRDGSLAAVVSLSAFAHPREVMLRWLRERRLPRILLGEAILSHVQKVIGTPFEAIAPVLLMPSVQPPVLLVHGVRDTTVPPEDARRLQAVRPGTEVIWVEADHDLSAVSVAEQSRMLAFLAQHLAPAPLSQGRRM